MYAIVEIAGQQFKVEEGKKIFVHRLDAKEGETVRFDKVLLAEDDGKVLVGEPQIPDFIVEAQVLNDKVRGDKVIVFKKKRKKGYRVKNGHRQNFTELEILHIGDVNAPRKERIKKESPEAIIVAESEETEKPAEKKSASKKSTSGKKAEKKEETSAKEEEKKAAPKKRATKKSSKKDE